MIQAVRYLTSVLSVLFFYPVMSSAHHAFAGIFDMNTLSEIEGEITELLWRNPHVRFSIETDAGEIWDIETNSVSIIQRMDISSELLSVGDRVRVAGFSERRGEKAMWTNNVLLADGRELVTRPGVEPHWLAEALGSSQVWLADGSDARDTPAEAQGIFRVWSTHFNNISRSLFDGNYPLTSEAAAVQAAYDPVADNPIPGCTPKGMPWIMSQPYPMELVEVGENVELRHEEFDLVRVIYMGEDATTEGSPTLLGHSVGRWDGSELVVETRGISWQFFDSSGLQHSDELELVERFAVNADGSELNYTLIATDPATFTEPVTLTKEWLWRPGEVVRPYECTTG
ncbi:MAG: DUF6152 family protein [Pseudomonadota bacterium]|nr:DUF6152 family protein [Pseudomonadota bacterium]